MKNNFRIVVFDKHALSRYRINPFTYNIEKSEAANGVKKGVLKNFAKFTGKPVPEPIFNKVAGLRPATLLKKILWHRCFPVNTPGQLLLKNGQALCMKD